MNQLIAIPNRQQLYNLFSALDAHARPLWGKMQPRQMVEHLLESVEYTNGKKSNNLHTANADALKSKQVMIYTDAQIPKNVILGELPEYFTYPDLAAAVKQLMNELDDFDTYFNAPGITAVHPGFGDLNHREWLVWHGKHFAHHLKQFNLLPG